MTRFGLPDPIRACLFDLDGVLTKTATLHTAAWKRAFDQFLHERADRTGEPFVPFDPVHDYLTSVDGRPRADGVRMFLASRGIVLPEGMPDDPPDARTVNGLGNRKNVALLQRIEQNGVEVYEGSRRYVEAVKAAGFALAVVSSSANTRQVLKVTGFDQLIDHVVDGVVARRDGLPGKPAPDTFLAGAALLGVAPPEAAVFEDARAGVAAGRAGGFGFVVGVDRAGHADELRRSGADLVVSDLGALVDPRPASPSR